MYAYKIVPILTEHAWTLSGGVPDEDRKPYYVWEESNTADTTRTNSGSIVHEQDSFVDMRKFPLIVLRTLQRYEGAPHLPGASPTSRKISYTGGHDWQTNERTDRGLYCSVICIDPGKTAIRSIPGLPCN